MSFSSFLLRTLFKKSDTKRDEGLTTPENVERFDDILYGSDPRWQSLDVYRPKYTNGKLPVIVSVHGGGWVYGDKEVYQHYCMSLVEHGFAVVNFTYRLAPNFKYPAQLEDVTTVFNWVLDNKDKYDLDPNNIFAVGDSCGAHLLSVYSVLCTNEEYAKQYSFKVKDNFKPKAVALNCGVYEVEYGKKEFINHLAKDLLKNKGTKEELDLINVLKIINSNFPPAYVMAANKDVLAVQGPKLVEALKALNVPVEFHVYGDDDNSLGHVFHCDIRNENAKKCNKDECDFFKSFMNEGVKYE